jgi:hypothetical protein
MTATRKLDCFWPPTPFTLNPQPSTLNPKHDSSWPPWADVHIKDALLQQVMTTVELGSFATDGGYRHLWMACMVSESMRERRKSESERKSESKSKRDGGYRHLWMACMVRVGLRV